MASTTAEVLLYFGNDGPKFQAAVDRLRFLIDPELTFREIVEILDPVFQAAYEEGYRDGSD